MPTGQLLAQKRWMLTCTAVAHVLAHQLALAAICEPFAKTREPFRSSEGGTNERGWSSSETRAQSTNRVKPPRW
eukprot:4661354-Alexandrium_andersonii.AAC.1